VSMSVLLLDIDHFKAYNDQCGHLAGDAALKAVAGVLTRCVKRPADLVARFGGEEFIACLPQTEEAGAMKAAEAIRAGVEALDLVHRGSPLGKVTVSIGVASVPGSVVRRMEALDLVKFADDAMYRAKDQGRNRVALAHRKELVRAREAATAGTVIEGTRVS
jgi:diguanylate cyclase (GGDEF)-like protein